MRVCMCEYECACVYVCMRVCGSMYVCACKFVYKRVMEHLENMS